MINVVYDRERTSVTVKGHAGSGETGHDLVCAAASALVYTLAVNIERIGEVKNVILLKGDAELTCHPRPALKAVTGLIFDTVAVGFEILAEQYPEYITYTIAQG